MKKEIIKVNGFKSIYKGVAPFMKYSGGFGYYGVLLEEEATGKLQCHLCGGTALNLAKHIFHKHKDMTPKKYKIETGLNLTTPLMAESTRKLIKNNFLDLTEKKKKEVIARLRRLNRKLHSDGTKKHRKNKASFEMNNKYGTCPEQVKNRFLQKYQELGRIPLWRELDGGLRYIFEHRFDSYEEAAVSMGISRSEFKGHTLEGRVRAFEARRDHNFFPKYDSNKVKKQYLDLFKIKGRFPTWGEIIQSGLPKRSVFIRAFGCNKSEMERKLLAEKV